MLCDLEERLLLLLLRLEQLEELLLLLERRLLLERDDLREGQVWPRTQLYSVGVLQSRINAKYVFFTNIQSRFPSVVLDRLVGTQPLARNT